MAVVQVECDQRVVINIFEDRCWRIRPVWHRTPVWLSPHAREWARHHIQAGTVRSVLFVNDDWVPHGRAYS